MENSEKRMTYVLGFCFSMDYRKIVLIRKKTPEWQAGMLNGVGGKIEDTETADEAMRREFLEEAGVELNTWTNFAVMHGTTKKGEKWSVECYRTTFDVNQVTTQTEEEIEIFDVRAIFREKIMYNLRWLINMALDRQVISAEIFNY